MIAKHGLGCGYIRLLLWIYQYSVVVILVSCRTTLQFTSMLLPSLVGCLSAGGSLLCCVHVGAFCVYMWGLIYPQQ